jgi:predicted phage terminase large subunit-like protein
LVDKVRGQWDFPETIAQFKRLADKHPKAFAKLVEAKANGQAVIDSLKKEIPGIIPIVPTSSKSSRLASCQPLYEAGNIFYPSNLLAPWIGQHIDELVGFPNAKNDDSVDAETQAIQWLIGSQVGKFSDSFTEFESSGFDNGKINW